MKVGVFNLKKFGSWLASPKPQRGVGGSHFVLSTKDTQSNGCFYFGKFSNGLARSSPKGEAGVLTWFDRVLKICYNYGRYDQRSAKN